MAAESAPRRDGSPPRPGPAFGHGALRLFLPIGVGLAIALAGVSAVERPSSRPRLDRVVLRGGAHISLHQEVEDLRDTFVTGDGLWRAKEYPSLMIGVHDDRVVAIISTQSAGVTVPGIRLGRGLDRLGTNLPPMTPTQFAGRPGVMLTQRGTQVYVLSAPTNVTCRFRATADQVVIASGPGVEMARNFFLQEQPCSAEDDKSGLV